MEIVNENGVFQLKHKGNILLESREGCPMIFVGQGQESVDMYRGNYKIEDYVARREPLSITSTSEVDDVLVLRFGEVLDVKVSVKKELAELSFALRKPGINRFWMHVRSDADEHVYGLGEQMSYFDLRGRNFPIWTSEPGVGRDKTTYVTWRSDVENKAGGDYYNTNYPEPTYVSSRHYYLHMDTSAYADFDFRHSDFHEIHAFGVPKTIRIEAADSFEDLLKKETAFLGRQPELPEWVYDGLIFGVQGGTARVMALAKKLVDAGVKLAGLWCQDWAGKRITTFGKRLQWDWHYNDNMYHDLPQTIKQLHSDGIKFLGYINPYLVNDGELYKEGKEKGYFAKKSDGGDYLVDFGEFYCGVVDLTSEEAFEWFKKEVIIKHSLDIGIDGWMADFGEYLPVDDIRLSNGVSPMEEHNKWPVRWARCNYEALKETGKLGKVIYFMRAGGTGSQKYCPLLWAGDQSVDFSRHDGLCTVINAALSSGLCGCGLNHSDIGGYTSLFGNIRTKELFLRWAEMAVFTPVMRTHEGNRPEENFQFYDDEDCIRRMARLVAIYRELAPYIKKAVRENAESGIPVQRPLFLHYEDDTECYTVEFEYLFGRDILVAPVWKSEAVEWNVYLPDDEWVHFWTGETYQKGSNRVRAKIGFPPAFYRRSAADAALFKKIGENWGEAEEGRKA